MHSEYVFRQIINIRSRTTRALKQEFEEIFSNNYIISFSLESDSLPMWNTYANRGMGIAIGIKRFTHDNDNNMLLKCLYNKELAYKKFIQCSIDEQAVLQWIFPLILKPSQYDYER